MKYNNYIGFILLVVFIGKLISVDAKFMEFASQNNFLSSINPNCKKILFHNDKIPAEYTSTNSDAIHVIQYLCSAPYNLELGSWNNVVQATYLPEINYRTRTFSSGYSKKLYPPPKA